MNVVNGAKNATTSLDGVHKTVTLFYEYHLANCDVFGAVYNIFTYLLTQLLTYLQSDNTVTP